jgi:hypothetical protein
MTLTAKKMAAISAAVTAYLAAESAARRKPAPPPPPTSAWGASGRAEAMQLRNLMQRRVLR